MWDAFPKELCNLARVLLRHAETERTGIALLGMEQAFSFDWKNRRLLTSNISFPIPPPRNKALHPHGCTVTDAELKFIFVLGNNIESVLIPEQSDFQVKVIGHAEYDVALVELEDHWRVDTHIHTDGPPPNEPHALVHFQRGGHAQDSFASGPNFLPGMNLPALKDGIWASLFQSPGPRVPFPPFCPILALDFTIGQHDGLLLNKLRSEPEYQEIIHRAQTRLWLPFFNGLAQQANRKRWLGEMLLDGV